MATLQAPVAGIPVFDRQDALLRIFGKLKDLAQQGGELAPFDQALMQRGVAGVLAEAAAQRPAEERDRIVTHAFSTALEPARDWAAKVKTILHYHVEGEAETVAVVDQLLCETIDGREPIKGLIGYSPDLVSALLCLLATLRGELDDRLPHTEELLALSDVVGTGGYEEVKGALLRRVRGALDGKNPLTRHGPTQENKALQQIADRLRAVDGYMGGPAMAETLMKRAKTAWGSQHNDLPYEEAVYRLSGRLSGPAASIGFLLDLAGSEYGHKRISFLVEQVATIFSRIKSVKDLALDGVSVAQIRDGLGRKLRGAGIPRALADQLMAKIAAVPDEERADMAPAWDGATVDLSAPPPKPSRLVLGYRGAKVTLAEEGGELAIGRSPDCQIVLEVASASRRHAVITRRGGAFVLSDASRNGTCVVQGQDTRTLNTGETMTLEGRGEIVIGSSQAGEAPAHILWEVR